MKHTLTLLAAVLLAPLVELQAANVISSPAATAQYGVRWKVIEDEAADFYLPRQRIESTAGLSVEAFDHIFPWSQIPRSGHQTSPKPVRVGSMKNEGQQDLHEARFIEFAIEIELQENPRWGHHFFPLSVSSRIWAFSW